MNQTLNQSNMKPSSSVKLLAAILVILPAVLRGYASDALPGADTDQLWQNAVASSSAAPTTSAPPPNTLTPSVASVGAPVTTKPAYAQYDTGWPRNFVAGNATNTLYQPQVVSWTGMVLQAPAVVSMQPAGAAEPTFGVLNLKALTFVDKVERLVHFEDVQVVSANFPSAPAKTAEFSALWLSLLKEHVRSVSLDRVSADLEVRGAQQKAKAVPIQNPAPAFIFSSVPAILVQVQGPPTFRQVSGTDVERILNTRAFLARAPSGQLYLHLWDGYVTAPSLSGPWTVASETPRSLRKAETQALKENAVDLLTGQANPETGKQPSLKTTPLPAIHVTVDPTELIVFAGPPNWLPIATTDLLYVTNTVANVFMYLLDQHDCYYGAVVAPDGLIVYGTGYYYTPWIGTVYIAPPISYGYGATLAWTP